MDGEGRRGATTASPMTRWGCRASRWRMANGAIEAVRSRQARTILAGRAGDEQTCAGTPRDSVRISSRTQYRRRSTEEMPMFLANSHPTTGTPFDPADTAVLGPCGGRPCAFSPIGGLCADAASPSQRARAERPVATSQSRTKRPAQSRQFQGARQGACGVVQLVLRRPRASSPVRSQSGDQRPSAKRWRQTHLRLRDRRGNHTAVRSRKAGAGRRAVGRLHLTKETSEDGSRRRSRAGVRVASSL